MINKNLTSLISVFCILILFGFCFSNSYFINQNNNLENLKSEKEKSKLINFSKLLLGFFSIKQIVIVDAQTLLHCCETTRSGASCQNVLDADLDSEKGCDDPIPTKCEVTPECKVGCCVDKDNGICSSHTTFSECENNGLEWTSDKNCDNLVCKKGCCFLYSLTKMTSKNECLFESEALGLGFNFLEEVPEYECYFMKEIIKEGACLIGAGRCEFMYENECDDFENSEFKEGFLCSNELLKNSLFVDYRSMDHFGCMEGLNEVYWFDSQNNRENIFEGDNEEGKIKSYNNGMISDKSESCGFDSGNGNLNSDACGNCDLSKGTTCLNDKKGIAVCGDLDCEYDINGDGKLEEFIDGESFCVYDSYIGDGKDTVGSEHWRGYCNNGKIEIEKCGEARTSICVQKMIKESGDTFSQANCIINEAHDCINYNSEVDYSSEDSREIERQLEKMKEKCNDDKFCMIDNVNVDNDFEFDACVPRYPSGSYNDNIDNLEKDLCSYADRTCTVVKKRNFLGNFKIESNSQCLTPKFTEEMNNFCVSLGDCGTYVNYVGSGSVNSEASGEIVESDMDLEWKDYIQYSKIRNGFFAEAPERDDFYSDVGGVPGEFSGFSDKGVMDIVGHITGGTGLVINLAANIFAKTSAVAGSGLASSVGASSGGITAVAGEGTVQAGIQTSQAAIQSVSAGFAAFSTVFMAMGIGAGLAELMNWLIPGLENEGSVMMSAGGIAAGFGVGLLVLQPLGQISVAAANIWNPVGWAALGAGLFISIWAGITRFGEIKTYDITFECLPWQAPTGNDYCSKCNDDPHKPCTKYKCESLGQGCTIINDGLNDENPTCESLKDDVRPPKISPLEVVTDGYSFSIVDDERSTLVKNDEDKCIREYTPIILKLETSELAQCKYDMKPSSDYDDMLNFFEEGNYYSKNHTLILNMPSVESFNEYNVTDEIKNNIATLYNDGFNVFVKCEDYFGTYNLKDYVIDFCVRSFPDETPINHEHTIFSVLNGSHIGYDKSELNLKMWTNEPAVCRYDNINRGYEEMIYEMSCNNDFKEGAEKFGWPCETTLEDLENDVNNVYIRCSDNSGNLNTQSIVYTIFNSPSELKIDSIEFESSVGDETQKISNGEKFSFGNVEFISVNMNVKTSGGANQGESFCRWGARENDLIQFLETGDVFHNQELSPRFAGDYINYLECYDLAGNSVNDIIEFSVDIDDESPVVARIMRDETGDKLKIITNEDAECYYDTKNCYYDFEGAGKLSGENKIHEMNWDIDNIYYIKCIDRWNNFENDCSAIIGSTLD